MTRPMIGDRHVALAAGVALVVAGAFLITDAYERRGRTRPFLMRFLPGG